MGDGERGKGGIGRQGVVSASSLILRTGKKRSSNEILQTILLLELSHYFVGPFDFMQQNACSSPSLSASVQVRVSLCAMIFLSWCEL